MACAGALLSALLMACSERGGAPSSNDGRAVAQAAPAMSQVQPAAPSSNDGVIAQATPALSQVQSLTAVQPSDSAAAAGAAVTNVTYRDAEAVYRKGRYVDAAQLLGDYVTAHPESISGLYMLGLSAWKAGDHARAEEALLRAVGLDSANVKARTNLSRVLLERGRAADALPHIRRAVELAPESHEVWRVLGNVQAELDRGDEALAAYRNALIRNEQDAWSMNNYGLVLIRQGRYEEAVPALARAVELVPSSTLFRKNLDVARDRSGLADLDLTAYAESFIEEIQRWRAARPEHDGC